MWVTGEDYLWEELEKKKVKFTVIAEVPPCSVPKKANNKKSKINQTLKYKWSWGICESVFYFITKAGLMICWSGQKNTLESIPALKITFRTNHPSLISPLLPCHPTPKVLGSL